MINRITLKIDSVYSIVPMMSIILELIKTHHLQGAMDGRNGRNMNQRSLSPILHQFSHTTMHALCCLAPGMLILWKYLGAEHANRACSLIRKILTFTFILLHSLLTYSSSCTPHFRYLRSISSLHSRLYLHRLSLL